MAVVGGIVLVLSLVSTFLGHASSVPWKHRVLLVVGGPIDGMLGAAVLLWLDVSPVHCTAGGVLVGVMSMLFLQPMLLPQRLMVWRLARENLLRRRRQTALLISGLVIASAIITSSLVVGDSLDATVSSEVQAAWGETDLQISGIDPLTGVPVAFAEEVAERYWAALTTDASLSSMLEGRQYGVSATVSVASPTGLAEPSVALFARNVSVDDEAVWAPLDMNSGLRFQTLQTLNEANDKVFVVVNHVAADELELKVGDELELGVFIDTEDGRTRTTASVTVHAIVPNSGQGAMAGTLSPAVFVDLAAAQTLLGLEDELNSISLALVDGLSSEEVGTFRQKAQTHLDEVLTAHDAGLVFTTDASTGALSVSATAGLQRLEGADVVALRENLTQVAPDASMLEVLQAPLIDVEVNNQSLLTLADGEVLQLRWGQNALWHVAASGVGFERFDDQQAWIWQVNEGGIVNDVAWSDQGQAVLIAHDGGFVLADEALVDEEERAQTNVEGSGVAATASVAGWLGLEEFEEGLYLHTFAHDFTEHARTALAVDVPNTVLSYALQTQGETVYLAVEGLLGVQVFSAPLDTLAFSSVDEGEFPSSNAAESTPLTHDLCNGIGAVAAPANEAWCTAPNGLLRYDLSTFNITGLRLPVLSDAPGFGRFPQMMLAFGGENVSLEVEPGEVLTSERLGPLNLTATSADMFVKGVLPYAYGNDSAVPLRPAGTYSALPGFEQLADLDAVVLGLVSLDDAEALALAGEDDRSMVMFSSAELANESSAAHRELVMWFDERVTTEDLHLSVRAVKLDAAEQAEASSGVLSAMFLVFGTFTIAAGVLLSLTIIMLLADVRRKELATARALGLRRSDARAMFVYEGAVAALVAGALGSVLGLVLAWVISVGFSSIFQSVGAQDFLFAWTLDSFLAGWIWGTLLSLLLLVASAAYNAQLNIVRALRDARPPRQQGVPWGVFVVQILGLGAAVLCAAVLVLVGLQSGLSYAAYVGLGGGLILVTVPLLAWELPVWLLKGAPTSWTRHAARNTLGGVGVMFLCWTLLLAPVDPLRKAMEPNELAFIVLGLLQVLSGVMVLTSWAPLFVQALSKHRLFGGSPVRSVALAHPLAHPVRTAVVMGMFSITMFSVVVLAGYTEQFDHYSADFVEEAEGEFELLLTSSRSRPISLGEDPSTWGLDDPALANIDAVGAVHRAPVHLEDADGERMPYLLRGVGEGFVNHGGLPLHLWDESLGETSEEAWISIGKFNDVVFLDASFGLESSADGSTLVPLQFSIGDSISLIDFSNPQNTKTVRVGGFLKQSSYLFSPGVWMDAEVVAEQFGGEVTRMYVSVGEEAEATSEAFATLDLAPQGKSVEERRAAAELEDLLDRNLAAENVNVQTVADEIMVIQSLVLAILSLFEGYLALGLIVGVAGIGVVTVRNVSERRRTVGMLRAIGFRQRHVLRMFSIEVSWIAVLGLLNGWLIGFGFHWVLYDALWAQEGVPFSFPWASTLVVFALGWLVVLGATALPVRQAARTPPSAALRTS